MKHLFGTTVLVIIGLVLFGPFLTIASINTLFNLDIGYTFVNYISMLWLTLVISSARVGN